MARTLDNLDHRLIELLKVNARLPMVTLAKALGCARSTVQLRLQALEDSTRAAFNPLLPWSAADERAAIGRHFRDGFEMYLAVRAYADFLARAPRTDLRRRAALREADATYNWLVNWDNNNSSFWSAALEGEGIGRVIRQAGRQ